MMAKETEGRSAPSSCFRNPGSVDNKSFFTPTGGDDKIVIEPVRLA